jgi:hypothetical protein
MPISSKSVKRFVSKIFRDILKAAVQMFAEKSSEGY